MTVTEEEVAMLLEAVDSHVYWQLSDPCYRDSGYVREPGSDDPEARARIARFEALRARLERQALEQ